MEVTTSQDGAIKETGQGVSDQSGGGLCVARGPTAVLLTGGRGAAEAGRPTQASALAVTMPALHQMSATSPEGEALGP